MNESKKKRPRFLERLRHVIASRFGNSNKYRAFANVDQLPKRPPTIKPLREVNGEFQQVPSVVIGGLSLIGEAGYICPVITMLLRDEKSDKLVGWSLCIGHPEQSDEVPYYFETSSDDSDNGGSARGTEIPNTMVYFQAEVDVALTVKDTPIEKLDEVIAYVLPHISDGGPPPPHPSDEVFIQMVSEQDDTWASAQAKELFNRITVLLDKVSKDFSGKSYDYWTLHDEINGKLHKSGLSYAWKSQPDNPDYNPNLGILEKQIGQKTVRVSIGLPSDRFAEACAVIQLTPYDD